MQLIKFISKGKVQGVFYRREISQKLNKLSISGYIKNLKDGTVEVVIENSSKVDINEILNILYEGSEKSVVQSVEMYPISEDIKLSSRFEVRY